MSTMKARLDRLDQRSRPDPAPVRFTIHTGEDDDEDAPGTDDEGWTGPMSTRNPQMRSPHGRLERLEQQAAVHLAGHCCTVVRDDEEAPASCPHGRPSHTARCACFLPAWRAMTAG
jgi:hypothetical protein